MSTNNNSVTLNVSVDTAHLDKLEAQLERIAELCDRINGHKYFATAFNVEPGKFYIKPATIKNAVLTGARDPLAIEAGMKAASEAARSMLERAQEMAASAAETDKRLAAAKQKEAEKDQALERRLLGIEAGIDHCMAGITSLRRRDSLV
ncbi:hypothetical protein [Serratia sp. TSA_105.2]|uniref:hypothetical protein n=1 Tax=Serratia sp. TSA_105.2 TaxID=3415660 RepID=UPI004046A82B